MRSVKLFKGILFTSLSCTLLGGISMIVGCEPKPTEMAPQATDRLVALRDQLFVAKSQVSRASASAKDLLDQPRTDLTPQIQKLQTEVAGLNATKAAASERGAEFRAETSDYFAKWDAQLASMSEETAKAGSKRLAHSKESVEMLKGQAANCRAELAPFMADLNEATRYLSTDTTKAGLEVVKPKLKNAVDREPAIQKAFDNLIAKIDAVRAGK